jgi:CRISPR-associated exonuclease Cas4
MEAISIRSIQHFLYCPHRWGLIEIDRAWAENYFVAKANILHERVHSPAKYASRGKHVLSAVKVWNDEYGIYGVTDCIEENNGEYTIVEYKPTAPKAFDVREDDALQIFAQKICVDSIFSTNCRAEIYYADIKKRVKLPFDTEYEAYNEKLLNTLQAMQKYKEAGQIPRVQAGQICNGCSMKDICIPSAFKKRFKLKDSIIKFAEDEL